MTKRRIYIRTVTGGQSGPKLAYHVHMVTQYRSYSNTDKVTNAR